MTLSDFQRARLVEFAVREAGPKGTVELMQAICLVMRNRARAGWNDGNLLRVIEAADDVRAHETIPHVKLDPDSRTFQLMLRQVDDIYFGQGGGDWGKAPGVAGNWLSMEESVTERHHEKLYYHWINRPVREWYRENILQDRENHKQHTQHGLMMFVE